MASRLLVHYGEIGTKGANRPFFEEMLERNIRTALAGLDGLKVRRTRQRIFVTVEDGFLSEAKTRLGSVFGIVWYAPVVSSPLSYENILGTARMLLAGSPPDSSFRVSARRSDKSFAMDSQELARKLGEDLMKSLGLKVKLKEPDTTLFVDVVWGEALLYRERIKGFGGLPVGSSGRVLHLLSGGIDSPVAGWLMMKRGCIPTYLHFYLAPGPRSVLESKVVELVRSLAKYDRDEAQLVLIPFAPYQLATASLPSAYEPIVFRRFVRMVAEALADRLGCSAISTGDNLAQVASQTLQNLVCIDSGSSLPTLRPLLAYDKEEIVGLAKQIGTYELSIKEYKDCCSIVSRHPRTRMKVEEVDEAVSYFKLDTVARECVDLGDIVTVPGDSPPQIRPLTAVLTEVAEARSRHLTR